MGLDQYAGTMREKVYEYTTPQGDKKEEKYNDTILNLIYKFPTRERITRARLEAEGAGDQNVKTSIYNRTALTIKDE